jgi:hypothetical protein
MDDHLNGRGGLMALVIEATAGHASANSYVTLAEAVSYFEGRAGAEAWDDATTAERNQALVSATTRLEQEQYQGDRTSSTQALAWPRSNLTYDGQSVDGATVPSFVKRATYEEALAILDAPDKYGPTGLEGFTSVDVGSVALGIRGDTTAPSSLSPMAARFLKPVRLGGGANTVTLIRS